MSYQDFFHLKRNLVILIALVLLLLVFGLVFRNRLSTLGRTIDVVFPSEQQVLDKLMRHTGMQNYLGWEIEIVYFSEQDVKELVRKQPTIYSDVNTDVYRVTFRSNNTGLLVLYDYDNDKIVKKFEILNPQLA